jgi:hypothetical protein
MGRYPRVNDKSLPPRRHGATFVRSLERGIEKSRVCFVVRSGAAANFCSMKTKLPRTKYSQLLSRILRLRARKHDRLLVVNMSFFNFTDGWRRVLSKQEYARFYA